MAASGSQLPKFTNSEESEEQLCKRAEKAERRKEKKRKKQQKADRHAGKGVQVDLCNHCKDIQMNVQTTTSKPAELAKKLLTARLSTVPVLCTQSNTISPAMRVTSRGSHENVSSPMHIASLLQSSSPQEQSDNLPIVIITLHLENKGHCNLMPYCVVVTPLVAGGVNHLKGWITVMIQPHMTIGPPQHNPHHVTHTNVGCLQPTIQSPPSTPTPKQRAQIILTPKRQQSSSAGSLASPTKKLRLVESPRKQAKKSSTKKKQLRAKDIDSNTICMRKLIQSHGAQVRGEVKTVAHSLMKTSYKFKSGSTPKIKRYFFILICCAEYDIYEPIIQDIKECKMLYKNEIISDIISGALFKNENASGNVHSTLFKKTLIPAIALVLAVVECSINEWNSGTHTQIKFTQTTYEAIYHAHCNDIEALRKATNIKIVDRIWSRIYHNGMSIMAESKPVGVESRISPHALGLAAQQYEDSATESNNSQVDEDDFSSLSDDSDDLESGGSASENSQPHFKSFG
ncbi:hypothetical protein NP233_g9769 [Leucocoprinus birnbaumii]|uniref:DUF6532 domain-containing protein n=1 Tax=Leucocoprinus birnbaumii TaxID=56174 RepID=A0AAD5VLJ4_9AGAR|nr:hypothetical protein NP233_g9769 [Leucocoprinus birnbaumii]